MKRIITLVAFIFLITTFTKGQDKKFYKLPEIEIDFNTNILFEKGFHYNFKRGKYLKVYLETQLIKRKDKFTNEVTYLSPCDNKIFTQKQIENFESVISLTFNYAVKTIANDQGVIFILDNGEKIVISDCYINEEHFAFMGIINKSKGFFDGKQNMYRDDIIKLLTHKITDIRIGLKTKYDIHISNSKAKQIQKQLKKIIELKDFVLVEKENHF